MKMKFKPSLFLLLLLFPTNAYASGNDIFFLIWGEVGLLVAILFFIFASRLTLKSRAIVFIVYVISTSIVFLLTADIPYNRNIVLIDCVNILVPMLSCFFTWRWLVKKERSTNNGNRVRHD